MSKKILPFFLAIFVFIGCDDDNPEITFSQISFSVSDYEIETSAASPLQVELLISPPAPNDSEVEIKISGLVTNADDVFQTVPETRNDRIVVPVLNGATMATFELDPVPPALGQNDIEFEFEIINVGDGLITQPLAGRFAQCTIINNESPPGSFIFLENFDDCSDSGMPPVDWQQVVIEQNQENSSQWNCISSPGLGIGINAFVSGSTDMSSSEVWFVSPEIIIPASSNPVLNFEVDRRFSPDDPNLTPYDLLISSDYDGMDASSANWIRFQPGFDAITANDPGADGFTNSGDLDLSSYTGESIHLALVYRAGAPNSFDATILRFGTMLIENI